MQSFLVNFILIIPIMAGYPSIQLKYFPLTEQFPQHILHLLPLYNAQWWGYESLTAIVLVEVVLLWFTGKIAIIFLNLIHQFHSWYLIHHTLAMGHVFKKSLLITTLWVKNRLHYPINDYNIMLAVKTKVKIKRCVWLILIR